LSVLTKLQEKNVPLKKLIPIIAKIIQNRLQTKSTFVILGKEANKAFTTSLSPSFLDIILRGLNALKALNDFNAFNDYASPPAESSSL
jgi:hypothetical protein